jgi:hypothetical protein
MSGIFNPIDKLSRKPKAKPHEVVKINFAADVDKVEEIKEMEKPPKEGEEELEKTEPPVIKNKIIDKRKFTSIVREQIFKEDKIIHRAPFHVTVLQKTPESKEHVIPIGEPGIKKQKKTVVIGESDKLVSSTKETIHVPSKIITESVDEDEAEFDRINKEIDDIISEKISKKREPTDESDKKGEPDIDVEDDVVEIETTEENAEEKPVEKEEEKEQPSEKTDKIKKKRGPKVKIVKNADAGFEIDLTTANINDKLIAARLPATTPLITIRAPTYYMNNRKLYIEKIMKLLEPYKRELADDSNAISCDRPADAKFELLTHQKILLDYLNLYTPYRGLLLYHGLGSGKSCSSIAIAEGMKTNKRVFIMTPASLKMNYFSELKKCGDELYKKNQYWEYISIDGKPEYVAILSKALSISSEYIRKHGGAWLVNIEKPANFSEKTAEEQKEIDNQLNEMIRSKYTDINYNGLNMNGLKNLSGDFTRNPFDNSVVIIDEAHNLVSRIVNKISKPKSLAYKLYHYLAGATNAKIVLLSGTPIINYPNEIGILFNILRGYIKTWTFKVNVETEKTINADTIREMFANANLKTYDYVEYTNNTLTITRNPFGFINTTKSAEKIPVKKSVMEKATKKIGDKVGKLVGGFSALFTGGKTKKHKKPSSQLETKTNTKTKKARVPRSEYDKIAEKIDYEELEIEPEASAEKAYRMGPNGEFNPQKGGADEMEKYNGVTLDDTGNMSDTVFEKTIIKILKDNGLEIVGKPTIANNKALPDNKDDFKAMFDYNEDNGKITNISAFQRRILGLTSYFRSAQEQLLPRFDNTEDGNIFHMMKCEMSRHQYGIYEKIRKKEADEEERLRKRRLNAKAGDEDISPTFRIFSRSACNFAFPEGIERPLPDKTDKKKAISENDFNAVPLEVRRNADENFDEDEADVGDTVVGEEGEAEEKTETEKPDAKLLNYQTRIQKALEQLKVNPEKPREKEYLSKTHLGEYSPKFVELLNQLQDEGNKGLHLIYSQFRTIEGVGILKLILEANGFAEFKLKKTGANWEIVNNEEDKGKPKFVLYTGTETAEEKELIRNIYNGSWDLVPPAISAQVKEIHENNLYGEIIKIFMITSSGAEGINLKNTRFVHLVDPYWHMVRMEQVIGRARRICSHQELPEDMRTVKVFLYLAVLSEEQKTSKNNIELRIRDVSKKDRKTPVTTDESLFEIASIKDKTNKTILKAVKETAIDCSVYAGKNTAESLVCYGYGKVSSNQFGSFPSFQRDMIEKPEMNVRKTTWKAQRIKEHGVEYALNAETKEVYTMENYEDHQKTGADLVMIGRLVKKGEKYVIEKI